MTKTKTKKNQNRKLTITREPIATLTNPTLKEVVGGVRCDVTGSACPNKTQNLCY